MVGLVVDPLCLGAAVAVAVAVAVVGRSCSDFDIEVVVARSLAECVVVGDEDYLVALVDK